MKPSLFKQVEAYPVPAPLLRASPRHWNPGLMRYREKLWLAYRYHRKDAGQRCGVAICPLEEQRFNPSAPSQFLRFIGPTGEEHHEDCRLFMFHGEPHISYTEMRGYQPGVDYTCVIKYARLSLDAKGKWHIEAEYQPEYGMNKGFSKEKNWVFFESDSRLFSVYSTQPQHTVIELDGHRAFNKQETPGPVWHWGLVRGGTSPLWVGDRWLSVFHSSLPNEVAPHFVRYYAGAYTFSAEPPFEVLQVSETPLFCGSEEDGHQVDPRYVAGWKPFVVFPCGIVRDGEKFLVSLGINDWQCAIARVSLEQMRLGAPDGSSFRPRFFRHPNGTVPIKYIDQSRSIQFMAWKIFRPGRNGMAGAGHLRANTAREAMEAQEFPGAVEITQNEYEQAALGLRPNSTMIVA